MSPAAQLLEQAKTRLEMNLETMRKEARREAQQRDDELEEVRGSFFKKIKGLECQLEVEHEERTLLLREKHELERRCAAMQQQDHTDRINDEAVMQKLRKDVRRYKALLKDVQAQLDRAKADTPGKILIRQLRNQLEDAEAERKIAIKSRQSLEAELAEVQALLEETQRGRSEAEERATHLGREKSELQTQTEENEEELAELIKKYGATMKQLHCEQATISDLEIKLSEMEMERSGLQHQIDELNIKLDTLETQNESSLTIQAKR